MKRIFLTFISVITAIIICGCSGKNTGSDVKTSPLTAEGFRSDIIDRISVQGKFDEWETENSIAYTRDGLEYGVTVSDDGYIQSLSTVVHNADAEYLKSVTYYDIMEADVATEPEKKASIDAIRYCAMALTYLCDLQDEDAIDTALDSRNGAVTENGWKITFEEQSQGMYVVFTAVYEGQE